jgi:hypothetical protein
MRRIFILTSCTLALAGCAVTSFAPPVVNLDQRLQFSGTQSSFNAVCSPKASNGSINASVDGALALVNNFILTYRCQADRAAEGRQFFEVPAFLTSAGAATAAAFGAGPAIAIGAGAAGATLNQGKSYYAPRAKAVVLSDGLDALLCIQTEAVGIDAFTLKTLSAAQNDSDGAEAVTGSNRVVFKSSGTGDDDGASISVSAERQYFEMVRSALFATERVVAQRLSAAGSPFDAAGVIAEIEKLNAKQAEDKKEAGEPETAGKDAKIAATKSAPAEAVATSVGPNGEILNIPTLRGMSAAQRNLSEASNVEIGRTVIKLKTLQPKLDKCVVRAKV